MLDKKFLLCVAALFLVLAVFVTLAGSRGRLDLGDARVTAALQHLHHKGPHSGIISDGNLKAAWLTSDRRGYTVNLGYELRTGSQYKWRLRVTFDRQGNVLEDNIGFWTTSMMPICLGGLSAVLLAVWAWLEFAVPLVFGVKCPDCTWNPLRPVLMHADETMVYPGGFDADGASLAPIVRRVHTCTKCGYRRISHCVPDYYRGTSKITTGMYDLRGGAHDTRGIMLTPREQEAYDKLVERNERWHAEHQASFATYEAWKEYFDGLKAQDRDEPSREANHR